jgi:hypothetical protein
MFSQLYVNLRAATLFGGKERSMKLPKGLFRRGSSYYTRIFRGGKDRWLCLGRDQVQAEARLSRIRGGELPATKMTVGDAGVRWLESYVRTARNKDGQRLAAARIKSYLEPYMGAALVSKVGTDDLRAYRVWLEGKRLSAQTVAHILADARCLLNWCEQAG